MEGIAREVKVNLEGINTEAGKLASKKFNTCEYILDGMAKLQENVEYVTEFKADRRFRLYQTSFHSFNGQSGDMERSFQDLANVGIYCIDKTLKLLEEEIKDMTSLEGDDLELAISKADSNPVSFISKALVKDDSPIKKPWNFVKFSKLIVALRNGETPYIGVAIGYDAKCSGPQLGALMTNASSMLVATGFTMSNQENLKDAYMLAIDKVKISTGVELSRSDMKKPFMAIFYGAGEDAMLKEDTIESGAHSKLYNKDWYFKGELQSQYYEDAENIAKSFHGAIVSSFGKELHSLRKRIKSFGGTMVDGAFECSLDNIIEHTMPCGAVVSMDYRESVDINGELITKENRGTSVSISVGDTLENLKYFKFTTLNKDLPSYSRTGFVNMIQATDALMARLIIKHTRDLGVQNIVSIHDCFRVDVNNTDKLQQAIKNAYLELFGSNKNEPTTNLPHSLDIINEYMIGANNASKVEYKSQYTGGQFIKGSGNRVCRSVKGASLTSLINALGTSNYQTFYFAK